MLACLLITESQVLKLLNTGKGSVLLLHGAVALVCTAWLLQGGVRVKCSATKGMWRPGLATTRCSISTTMLGQELENHL